MTRSAKFACAFLLTTGLAALVNAIPLLLTRGAYQHDGQEVAGFPFVFRRVGGDCWPAACDTYALHAGYFMADLVIAVACALVVGAIAARLGVSRRHAP